MIRTALTLLALLPFGGVLAQTKLPAAPPAVTALPVQCVEGYSRPDFRQLRADYARSIARWKQADLRHYTFEYAQWAAPIRYPDTLVTVRGGLVNSALPKPGEDGRPSPTARYTMARHFLNVWATIVQAEKQPCPELQVSYDPQYGFPSRLYVGQAVQHLADGNGEWQIRHFRVLGEGQ